MRIRPSMNQSSGLLLYIHLFSFLCKLLMGSRSFIFEYFDIYKLWRNTNLSFIFLAYFAGLNIFL